MDYREADDLYFSIVQESGTALWETAKTTEFPQTYRAMFGFCTKLNALKTALFDMIDSDNPYAFKALFRCYCDHYLKFTYVFVRFLGEKSDAVGREYFSYCGAMESREYLKSLVTAEGLLGNDVKGDLAGAIAALYPDAASLSVSELEQASAKFKYRAIVRFLVGDAGPMRGVSFLPSIIPAFAEYSSFVHGGPWADMDMRSYASPEPLERCREDAGLAFMMTASVFMFTAMAVSREFSAVGHLVPRVKAVIDQYRTADADEPGTEN